MLTPARIRCLGRWENASGLPGAMNFRTGEAHCFPACTEAGVFVNQPHRFPDHTPDRHNHSTDSTAASTAGPDTYLDPEETPSHPTPTDNSDLDPCVEFRHSGWAPVRRKVQAALAEAGTSEAALARFSTCGCHAWIQRHVTTGNHRLVSSHCHNRWCTPCQKQRARMVAHAINEYIGTRTVRFITLTLKHTSDPLKDQLDRLYESFARLRRQRIWKAAVGGGLAICEVTLAADLRWHPHLHILCTGRYLPHRLLAEAWQRTTGDSHIVDIRLARGSADVSRYIAKYVSKGVSQSVFRHQPSLVEAIKALHGRRLLLTFGSWRDFSVTNGSVDLDASGEWQTIGSLRHALELASSGDEHWQRIVSELRHQANDRPTGPPTNLLIGD
jgi:hypothetical protein